MTDHVLKIVEEIGRDIVALAQFVIDNDSVGVNKKAGKNTLRDSLLIRDVDAACECPERVGAVARHSDRQRNAFCHSQRRQTRRNRRPPHIGNSGTGDRKQLRKRLG